MVIPAGGVESDQVVPPSWVTMMEATSAPLSPTATQVAELAVAFGAQETALTLASGAYAAVVCQVGVTAAAGGDDTRVPTMLTRARANTIDSATAVIPRTARTATPVPTETDSMSVGSFDPRCLRAVVGLE